MSELGCCVLQIAMVKLYSFICFVAVNSSNSLKLKVFTAGQFLVFYFLLFWHVLSLL